MTHDELLDKIETILGSYISKYYGNKKDVELRSNIIDSIQALRAVVELHRPEVQEHKQYEKCWNCNLLYPCPTIQAIVKEFE